MARSCSWGLRVLVAVAILSLAAGLAGRTFQHSSNSQTAVHSDSSPVKLQHLDRDSLSWSVPVARFLPPLWREVTAHVPAPQPPALAAGVHFSRYNRPPPSC